VPVASEVMDVEVQTVLSEVQTLFLVRTLLSWFHVLWFSC
jgi:hypothetical protein